MAQVYENNRNPWPRYTKIIKTMAQMYENDHFAKQE